MMKDPAQHRFLVLDGMRGTAALMVLVGHATGHQQMTSAAVDLFFLLSGFVLTHAFGERLTKPGSGRRFLVERLIRLAPLYYIATAIAMLVTVVALSVGLSWLHLKAFLIASAAAPFLLPVPFDGFYPLNTATWSLAAELGVNVLLAFIGASFRTALITTLVCLLPLCVSMFMPDSEDLVTGAVSAAARVGFSFFLGVLMYRLWQRARLPRLPLPVVLLAASPLALYAPGPNEFYYLALLLVIHPLLMWSAVHAVTPQRWERLLAWLGFVSYGVYVLHLPILAALDLCVRILDPAATMTGHWYAVFIVAILAAATAHWLTLKADIPARAWLRSRLLTGRPGGTSRQGKAANPLL